MIKRVLTVMAFSMSFGFLGGCADQLDHETDLAFEEGALGEICTADYAPVCGKDGETYGNACLAGGQKNIAYEGECDFLCAAITCLEGQECAQTTKTRAGCYEIQTGGCELVRCASGKCVDLGGGGAICTGN